MGDARHARKEGCKGCFETSLFWLVVAKHVILQPPAVSGGVIHREERLPDISEILIVLELQITIKQFIIVTNLLRQRCQNWSAFIFCKQKKSLFS